MNRYIEKLSGLNAQSKDPLMPRTDNKPVFTAMDVMSALVDECPHIGTFVVASAQDSTVPKATAEHIMTETIKSFLQYQTKAKRWRQVKQTPIKKLRSMAEFVMMTVHQQKQLSDVRKSWGAWAGHQSNYQFAKVEPILDQMFVWLNDEVNHVCFNAYKKIGFDE